VRVLVIHNDYQQPGGELVAVDAQIDLLRRYGHQVILYRRDNSEIGSLSLAQRIGAATNSIFSPRTYREIRKLAREDRPDIAHVHNVFPLISPSAYIALKDAGVPIVQTIHNYRLLCPNALFFTQGHVCDRCKQGNTLHAVPGRCFRQNYALSTIYALSVGLHRLLGTFDLVERFIAPTEFIARQLLESNLVREDRIAVLGHFVPDPMPSPGCLERRGAYVLYLGRLSPEKGVSILVDAMAGIPNLQLYIAGDGPLAASLLEQVRQLGLRNVLLLGNIAGERKWDLLRNAIATVVPPIWYEPFGITVLESFAAGTPVIASNLGSLPYIVAGGETCLLFSPGDPGELQQKLLRVLQHPDHALAMGRKGLEQVRLRFCADAHYQYLMSIYRQVAG